MKTKKNNLGKIKIPKFKNQIEKRRHFLIDKEMNSFLTEREIKELEILQEISEKFYSTNKTKDKK